MNKQEILEKLNSFPSDTKVFVKHNRKPPLGINGMNKQTGFIYAKKGDTIHSPLLAEWVNKSIVDSVVIRFPDGAVKGVDKVELMVQKTAWVYID